MTVMTQTSVGVHAPARRSGIVLLVRLSGLLAAAVLVGLAMILGA